MFRHKCVCRNIRERTYVVLHVVNKLKPDAPPNKNPGTSLEIIEKVVMSSVLP